MAQIDPRRSVDRARLCRAAAPFVAAAAWFASAWLSVFLTRQANGLAAVWPANAILLAALLQVPIRRWAGFIAATVLASMVMAELAGHVGVLIFGYGVANVAEAVVAAILLRLLGHQANLLDSLRGVSCFTASCLAACACSATIGVELLMWHSSGSLLSAWTSWFASDVLGLLIVTPILLIGSRLLRQGQVATLRWRRTRQALVCLGAVGATCCLVFSQHAFPLLFLIYPPVLVATYRLRAPGAAASALIVVAVGLWSTAHGEGPAAMIRGTAEAQMFFFQFYVAFVFLSTLPVGTLLADLDALAAAKRDAETALRATAERAADEARLLAATDELTGLNNRREFFRRLTQEIDRTAHTGEPLGLALFDVDHFKKVNDRFGHAGGDLVLKRLAALALGSVRTGDVVGRIGGEEFGVLLPGIDIEAAVAISERLRRRIEDLTFENGLRVTVSIGLAMQGAGIDADTLLGLADDALYVAKREGRNVLRQAA